MIWGLDVLGPIREGSYLIERVVPRHAQIVKGWQVFLDLQFAIDSYGQADLTLVFLGPGSAHMERCCLCDTCFLDRLLPMPPITHFNVKLSHLTQDLVIKTVGVVGMRWLLLAEPGQRRLSLALSRFLWSSVAPSGSHWPAWALTRSRCDPEC